MFISFSDPDKVVSMSEIKVSVNAGFLQGIQKVSKKGSGIMILLCYFIKGSEVHTELE